MELNWENAKLWMAAANAEREEWSEPAWSWDCGFKLDFDGPVLRISSRFYPPHKNDHDGWEGKSTLMVGEAEIFCRNFKCASLEELKTEAEEFASGVRSVFEGNITALIMLLEANQ